jgi:DNA invertase Pin-like site-specific DNA recombinase
MEPRPSDTPVMWGLDRPRRTAQGWISLFDDRTCRKVNLIGLKDGPDPATPMGRLMADIPAGLAASATDVRAGRILSGQTAARMRGFRLGSSPRRRRIEVTAEQGASIRRLRADGQQVAALARGTGLARPTVDRALGEGCQASTRWGDSNRSGKWLREKVQS